VKNAERGFFLQRCADCVAFFYCAKRVSRRRAGPPFILTPQTPRFQALCLAEAKALNPRPRNGKELGGPWAGWSTFNELGFVSLCSLFIFENWLCYVV
jgi:hypothetical protein